jgi:chromosome segregation ATPase
MSNDKFEQRVNWLDEQRRKDAELVSRLAERVETWESMIKNQERQIKEMSGDIARLSALSSRVSDFDDSLAKHREDVAERLDENESLHRERDNQLNEKLRQHQNSTVNSLEELREELQRVEDLEQAISARKEEEQRVSRELDSLEQRIERVAGEKDDLSRIVVALEEGRGQQTKRVSELQMETSELRVRIDTVRGELDTVGDRLRRISGTVAEISGQEADREERQRLAAEQQEIKIAAVEREWRKWEKSLQEQEAKVDHAIERFAVYEETLRNLKEVEKSVSQAVERFERRLHEMAEMQRLSEERIKQEWTAFQADNQKRWNTHKLTFDEHWREHRREHEKITGDHASSDEGLSELRMAVRELEAENKRRIADLVELVHQWATGPE